MATYAIGDIQGCHQELLDLLDKISFDGSRDELWFAGDLVNRGPDSLGTLRLVKKLDSIVVLGNHDLHLLAIAAGKATQRKKDTLDAILNAPDRDELLDWLQHRPLLHRDKSLGYTMMHAGLPPQWGMGKARSCAREIEDILRGKKSKKFFANMYGDKPDKWSEDLQEWDRYRFITNCLTRIRYCDIDGRLTLKDKGTPGSQDDKLVPWYKFPERKSANEKLLFGHWATLRLGKEKNFASANVYPLDNGCVWGGTLTAMCLEDGHFFHVAAR